MGVVLGSNVFNLAAMIGMSAVLAGAVHLTRRSLMVEGAVALLAALIAAGLILDMISAGIRLTRSTQHVADAGLTPIHRVASANAARLGRAAAQAA